MEEKVAKVLDNPTIRCCYRDRVQSISLATTRKRVLGWISSCSETKYSKSGTMAGRLRDQVPFVLDLSYHHYPSLLTCSFACWPVQLWENVFFPLVIEGFTALRYL